MGLVKCEKIKDKQNDYILEISVGKDAFFAEINKVYKKNVAKINVPGFRKGKAPRAIIEKMYGNNIFWDEAINNLYPQAYMTAAKEVNLEVVSTNKVDVVSVDIDNGFVFKVECTVAPEVELGQYKELEVTQSFKVATNEDVDNEISRIRNSYARKIDVTDRAAQIGDLVVINFEGKIDGKPFDGGKSENYELTLGSGHFIPGFEEQIVGHKVGEEFDVNVTFPKDYHSEQFSGKDAVFNVILQEIKIVELPELDDEFIKDISEFDNIEDFKADVKKSIQAFKDKESDKEVEDKLVDKLIAKTKVELPPVMVEQRISSHIKELEDSLKSQKIKMDDYLKYIGQTMEDLRKQFEPKAVRGLKLNLILKKIAQLENFEVSQSDIESSINEMSEIYRVPVAKIKDVFDESQIIENVKINKAIALVKDTAKVKKVVSKSKK